MTKKKIAVVILNWNGKALLQQFLPTVIAYSEEATIYVADNASTDDSVHFVSSTFPNVKLILNKTNGGYAKGYNDALNDVDEEIFCLLNSDVEVTKDWLQPILAQFEKEPETAIIQPKLLDYKNKNHFEYAGAAGGFIDKYAFPYCRGRIFSTVEKDHGQYNDIIPIFWASGACFFIRKTVFNKLKGFDELFFAHMEEIDLCWRAHNLGYTVKYVGNSTVYHVGGATLDSSNPQKTFLNFRNSLFTLTKNSPTNPAVLIFSRLVLDSLAVFKFLSVFKFQHVFAILKAHFTFYSYLPRILKDRQTLREQIDPLKVSPYYTIKSIVWRFYFKKSKRFSDL